MMTQKFWIYLVLLLIVLGGGVSLWVARQEIGQTPEDDLLAGPDQATEDIVGENVTFTITEKEHKKWELRVKRVVYSKDRSAAILSGVSGEFFNDAGETVATFEAPKGRYIDEKKAVTLTDGVKVLSADEKGGMLSAARVTWSSRSDEVSAEGGVLLDLGGYAKSRAERCTFALDFSKVSLIGAAHSEIAF